MGMVMPVGRSRRTCHRSPFRQRWNALRAVAAFLFFSGVSLVDSQTVAEEGPPQFEIHVTDTDVYRVSFRDLGLTGERFLSHRMGLTLRGKAVPLWMEDRGDGIFDRGDWFEFVGERLQGEFSSQVPHGSWLTR